MTTKEKQVKESKPKKERTQSVEELRERKNFMVKMALGTFAVLGILTAIVVPIILLVG